MKGITTCLWFDGQAEAAARFYTSVFKNSRMGSIAHYGDSGAEASGQTKGTVMVVEFELAGHKYLGLNGGPDFQFTEATSQMVICENQQEIDYFWAKLSEGGSEGVCGWLKDKYGLSWQVVPAWLSEMWKENDPLKSERVMAAVLKMKKLDLATLQRAAEGKAEPGRGRPASVGGRSSDR